MHIAQVEVEPFIDNNHRDGVPPVPPYGLSQVYAGRPRTVSDPGCNSYHRYGSMPFPRCSGDRPEHPDYIFVPEKYLAPETLDFYGLPWEYDKRRSSYILLHRCIDPDFLAMLFAHSHGLKLGLKLAIPTNSDPPSRTRSADSIRSDSLAGGQQSILGEVATKDENIFLRLHGQLKTLEETENYAQGDLLGTNASLFKRRVAKARLATAAALYSASPSRGMCWDKSPEKSHSHERDHPAAASVPNADYALVPESSGAAAACGNYENKELQYRLENVSTLSRPLESISINIKEELGQHIGVSLGYQQIGGEGQIELRFYPVDQNVAQANAPHSHSITTSINELSRSHQANTSENAESANPQKGCGQGKTEAQPDCNEDSVPSSLNLQPEFRKTDRLRSKL